MMIQEADESAVKNEEKQEDKNSIE